MSEIQVENITARDSNSAPNFAGGITFGGLSADSAIPGLLTPSITVSNIEPDSATVTRGNFWFNDSGSGSLSLYNDNVWWTLGGTIAGPAALSGAWGVTGLIGGGWYLNHFTPTGSAQNVIDYVTISTTGNATDFGDLTQARHQPAAGSDGTYVYWATGHTTSQYGTKVNTIDYVTVASAGNATDFGDHAFSRNSAWSAEDGTIGIIGWGSDGMYYITVATPGNSQSFGTLTQSVLYSGGGHSNVTYGCVMGDWNPTGYIDRWTMATPSNATDFGDCYDPAYLCSACGDLTYMIMCGGVGAEAVLQYITMDTPGNSTDFGDLNQSGYLNSASEDGTYAIVAGRNQSTGNQTAIDTFVIATPGNATDFGDLTVGRSAPGSASGT